MVERSYAGDLDAAKVHPHGVSRGPPQEASCKLADENINAGRRGESALFSFFREYYHMEDHRNHKWPEEPHSD